MGGIFLNEAGRPDEINNTTPFKLPKVECFNKYYKPLKFKRTKYLLTYLTGSCQRKNSKISLFTPSLKQ